MVKRDEDRLHRIIDRISQIGEYVAGMDEAAFLADRKTQDAVCMNILNVGELVKQLSDEFRQAHPQIPWRLIAGMRDVAAHGYDTLIWRDVWETVAIHIPNLQIQIAALLVEDGDN